MQKARRHKAPKCSTPTDDKHAVSGSISLPSRGAFHLSLTVLLHYRSPKVFSLTRWSSLIHPGFLVPRATRVLATSLTPFRIRDYHPLRSYFPVCSPIKLKTISQVPLPPDYSGFRLLPVRSPLLRKSLLLSLPAGTKMFQFPALAHCACTVCHSFSCDGLPHSETHGSKLAYSSPWLIAVNRVLRRLLVPRHPPHALSSSRLSFLTSYRFTYIVLLKIDSNSHYGGGYRIRTDDLRLARAALSQLS